MIGLMRTGRIESVQQGYQVFLLGRYAIHQRILSLGGQKASFSQLDNHISDLRTLFLIKQKLGLGEHLSCTGHIHMERSKPLVDLGRIARTLLFRVPLILLGFRQQLLQGCHSRIALTGPDIRGFSVGDSDSPNPILPAHDETRRNVSDSS